MDGPVGLATPPATWTLDAAYAYATQRAVPPTDPDGEPLYNCPFPPCSKQFSKRFNLKAHLRVHTGDKPFACSFPGCTRRFMWKSSLTSHQTGHSRRKQELQKRNAVMAGKALAAESVNNTPANGALRRRQASFPFASDHAHHAQRALQPTQPHACLTSLQTHHPHFPQLDQHHHQSQPQSHSHLLPQPKQEPVLKQEQLLTFHQPTNPTHHSSQPQSHQFQSQHPPSIYTPPDQPPTRPQNIPTSNHTPSLPPPTSFSQSSSDPSPMSYVTVEYPKSSETPPTLSLPLHSQPPHQPPHQPRSRQSDLYSSPRNPQPQPPIHQTLPHPHPQSTHHPSSLPRRPFPQPSQPQPIHSQPLSIPHQSHQVHRRLSPPQSHPTNLPVSQSQSQQGHLPVSTPQSQPIHVTNPEITQPPLHIELTMSQARPTHGKVSTGHSHQEQMLQHSQQMHLAGQSSQGMLYMGPQGNAQGVASKDTVRDRINCFGGAKGFRQEQGGSSQFYSEHQPPEKMARSERDSDKSRIVRQQEAQEDLLEVLRQRSHMQEQKIKEQQKIIQQHEEQQQAHQRQMLQFQQDHEERSRRDLEEKQRRLSQQAVASDIKPSLFSEQKSMRNSRPITDHHGDVQMKLPKLEDVPQAMQQRPIPSLPSPLQAGAVPNSAGIDGDRQGKRDTSSALPRPSPALMSPASLGLTTNSILRSPSASASLGMSRSPNGFSQQFLFPSNGTSWGTPCNGVGSLQSMVLPSPKPPHTPNGQVDVHMASSCGDHHAGDGSPAPSEIAISPGIVTSPVPPPILPEVSTTFRTRRGLSRPKPPLGCPLLSSGTANILPPLTNVTPANPPTHIELKLGEDEPNCSLPALGSPRTEFSPLPVASPIFGNGQTPVSPSQLYSPFSDFNRFSAKGKQGTTW